MAKKISNPIDKHVGSRGVPLTEAFPWTSAPTYLVRDNDRAYGHVFTGESDGYRSAIWPGSREPTP